MYKLYINKQGRREPVSDHATLEDAKRARLQADRALTSIWSEIVYSDEPMPRPRCAGETQARDLLTAV